MLRACRRAVGQTCGPGAELRPRARAPAPQVRLVDVANRLDLLVDVYEDRTIITESGIHDRNDVLKLRKHGVNAFLVGEVFMAADDPGKKLAELFY